MKPCKLRIHLEKKHTGEKDKPVEYFKILRDNFQARETESQFFNNKVCKMSDGLLASYEISKIIAKAGKPHNVGETVILPAVSVIISSVMKQNASEITNSIPLSIDEVAEDLQRKDSDLISSKSAVAAFLRKLKLYKNNIRRRAFEQFPCLASVDIDLQDEDLALYGEYMENMHEDMQTRFSDLLMMVIPTWVSIPFEVNVADIDISLQEPLIEL
ncbi:zinc finger BED domain-containing protein 5-like [Tachypleus tridentatus]|uniref:zinc finger BED domain-containing protein 5-like n=1 Tax=Tachypleus tridentatus TaxID=6853 RepID=UPI003FCF28C9